MTTSKQQLNGDQEPKRPGRQLEPGQPVGRRKGRDPENLEIVGHIDPTAVYTVDAAARAIGMYPQSFREKLIYPGIIPAVNMGGTRGILVLGEALHNLFLDPPSELSAQLPRYRGEAEGSDEPPVFSRKR